MVNTSRIETFVSGGSITYLKWDCFQEDAKQIVFDLKPAILFSFPPCTDLAVSGAKHFEFKYFKDKDYMVKSMQMVLICPSIANEIGIPWFDENPVGVLSSNWRKPDRIFDPCDFGGYLAPDDVHPEWPEYISPRDGYLKKTCIWGGNDLLWPQASPVPFREESRGFNTQTSKLGGKSEKTKQIRSMTPRGFARAIFEANYTHVTGKVLS